MTIQAVIDRYEGDRAVLLLGEKESASAVFPSAFLPPGTDEGDHLKITITRDRRATARAGREAASLLAALRERNS
ncbi:MAG: DUF3006 domain-containing protein [Schwartzia sp.]|nr:DUF3006 domain-containing protein [Schwartzia sp. (in: firmicutes)]